MPSAPTMSSTADCLVAALALLRTMFSTSKPAKSRLLIVVGYTLVNWLLVVKISTIRCRSSPAFHASASCPR
jgi:hypothetical protein